MKNMSLKIWSILIACAIAYGVHNQSNAGVITLLVPVQMLNLPEEKVILLPKSPQAKVTVRGPSFLLSKITSNPPSFQVTVDEEVKNRLDVALQPGMLELPSGIEVMSIDPGEIEYVFDDRTIRDLPVVVPRIGQVSSNVRLTSIEIEPRVVQVTGAKGELQGLKTIETRPLDIRDITESRVFNLSLRLPGSLSQANVDSVKVSVNVLSLQMERVFEDLAIEVRSDGETKYSLSPAQVTVEISGSKKTLSRLKSNKIIPYVRIAGEQEPRQVKVGVDLPKGVELVVVTPESVKISPNVQNVEKPRQEQSKKR